MPETLFARCLARGDIPCRFLGEAALRQALKAWCLGSDLQRVLSEIEVSRTFCRRCPEGGATAAGRD